MGVASAEEGDEDLGGDAQGEGDEAKEPNDGDEGARGGHGRSSWEASRWRPSRVLIPLMTEDLPGGGPALFAAESPAGRGRLIDNEPRLLVRRLSGDNACGVARFQGARGERLRRSLDIGEKRRARGGPV